jgi:CRISPR-associated protein Cst1
MVDLFINAPSFKIMWYLNKFVYEIFSWDKKYNIRKLFGMNLMELSQKVYTSLGVWSMMNIEMAIKNRDKINYYFLPYEITTLLLNIFIR